MFWGRKKILLQPGDLRFVLPNGGHWESDLTIVKLICESLERSHNLQTVDGRIEATESFLESLAEELNTIGCVDCSPTLARQIWIAVADQFNRMETEFRKQLKKL